MGTKKLFVGSWVMGAHSLLFSTIAIRASVSDGYGTLTHVKSDALENLARSGKLTRQKCWKIEHLLLNFDVHEGTKANVDKEGP